MFFDASNGQSRRAILTEKDGNLFLFLDWNTKTRNRTRLCHERRHPALRNSVGIQSWQLRKFYNHHSPALWVPRPCGWAAAVHDGRDE
jgi:hypothetical protein